MLAFRSAWWSGVSVGAVINVGIAVADNVEAGVAVATSVGVAGKRWNWLAQYAGVANNGGVATIPASDTAVTVALG